MLRGAILLYICMIGSSNEEGDWLKCKPKPGCSIARCDPPPGHWLENLDKLDDYSILCQKNEPPEYSKELAKLKGRLERSEREGSEMKAEMKILKKKNARIKDQMQDMESRMRKEMDENESALKNMLKEWQELKDKLDEMKRESDMRRGREKANVSGDLTFNGIGYWAHVEDGWNVNVARAEEICLKKASTLAHFSSERVYNAVVEDLRSKIPPGKTFITAWTAVRIDTKTGNVIHPSGSTYVKWLPNRPLIGSSYETRTHIGLQVYSDSRHTNQGMFNRSPQLKLHGVVCQSVE